MANNSPIRPPTIESLALASSSWAFQIDSWIPSSFASSSSTTLPKLPDLAEILESAGDENDRLGLGHPSIGKPKRREPGLKELEKRLTAKAKGKAREEALAAEGIGEPANEDIEESRGRLGGRKRRNVAMDLLGGKKQKKGKGGSTDSGRQSSVVPPIHPPAVGSKVEDPDDLNTPSEVPDDGPSTPPRHTATSSPGGSGVFPFEGPIAPDSPAAKRLLSERKPHADQAPPTPPTDDDVSMSPSRPALPLTSPTGGEVESGAKDIGANGGLSKSALRRAKRKAKKEVQDDVVPP